MDYLETAKKEIRERWFVNHKIKKIEGQDGFQKIVWGEEGSSFYQINYVLSGNMVFISGDLGVAAYSLTGPATMDDMKTSDLSYFTGKLTAHQRDKYEFDEDLARKEIKEYVLDWCEVEKVSQLKPEDKELLMNLLSEASQWSNCQHFSTGIYAIYQDSNADWFDSESASCIADCGKRLSYSIIAYWLGLKMIIEQMKDNEQIA